jgi:Xaa-Pro aminopeptidase
MITLPFSKEEYATRLTQVRKQMQARNLDLLVISDIANQHYLTAYDGWSFYAPQVVLVPLKGEPIWVGRAMDVAGGRLTAWMSPENVVGYPETYIQKTDCHPIDWIGGYIAENGWTKSRIGVELDAYYYTAKTHARLTAALPGASFADASLLVSWVRSVKSPAELVYMRNGAKLAQAAVECAFEVIAPGVRECDAVAKIQAVQVGGSPDFAGDFPGIPPIILAGEKAAAPHVMWSDRKYQEGETVAIELAGSCRHYTACLARTLQLGTKPQKVVDVEKALLEGMDAVLAAARPGALGHDVWAAWQEVIGRYGIVKDSRIGYSVGLGYAPDWGDHTISFRKDDQTVLTPGQTVHTMIGMWMDGWGIELSETVVITDKGCDTLSTLPREIRVKP